MKKVNILLIVLTMVVYTFSLPAYSFANDVISDEQEHSIENIQTHSPNDLFIVHSETNEDKDEANIPLFDSMDEKQSELMWLLNGNEIKVLKTFETYSLVEVEIVDEKLVEINENINLNDTLQGYVENKYIFSEDLENEIEDTNDIENDSPLIDDDTVENNEEVIDTDNNSTENITEEIPSATDEKSIEDNEVDYDISSDQAEIGQSNEDKETNTLNNDSTETTEIESEIDETQIETKPSFQITSFSVKSNSLRGVVKKEPTNIRATPSTKAKIIQQFPIGSVIEYEPHSEHWFRILVNVNGKSEYGYIHKKHVTTVTTIPQNLKGVAKKEPTNVRAGASTKAKIIKQFPIGSVLNYKSFSKNWNEITVEVDGKTVSGFIHKKHVTNVKTVPENFKGVAKGSPTNMYAGASTESKIIHKFPIGEVLEYKTLSKNWNEISTIIGGKRVVGYILKKDVTNVTTKPVDKKVVTLKSPTNVRAGVSTKAEILTQLPKAKSINVKTFSKNWYSYTANINGVTQTGYIHKKHVGEKVIKTTNYNLTLTQAVNIQKKKLSLTSGSNPMYVHKDALKKVTVNGRVNWIVNGNNWNVRNAPNTTSSILGQISENTLTQTNGTITVDEKNSTKDFYKFYTSWIVATDDGIKKQLDPNSFSEDDNNFYQFLVLSQPAGTNEKDVNNKILSGKGILEGKASSFIKAASEYNINELYLISHAMLETGNGTSSLSKGNEVGKDSKGNLTLVTKDNRSKLKEIKKVYNMYGIGAVDGDALRGGAITAYKEGWTSPDLAIRGGAKFIAEKYISPGSSTLSGQDTLYKMRWHPEGMEKLGDATWHQYASDIAWASKQTSSLKNYYNVISEYNLIFDVPKFK